MDSEISRKLNSIDWDFTESTRKMSIHSIHPYPAKFIREIPIMLIQFYYPGDKCAVLDPFCGSGTTLVESVLANVPAIGIDLHPLATLLAKVKTTIIDPDELRQQARRILSCAKQAIAERRVAVPQIPNLNHWFQVNVQECLAALRQEINAVASVTIADALRICFSSIIVRVSNQESDTRYAAIDKNINSTTVWKAFENAAENVASALEKTYPSLFTTEPDVRIINKDILKVMPYEIGNHVGLVVTSPPYPNAYEYWLYHKYRMYWLGMDPISVREQEIGARPHFFKKNPHTAKDFERQMAQCFWLLSKVMRPHAIACFVVGRSVIKGHEIDNERILVHAASSHGFRRIDSVSRQIAADRKSFNPSHGRIEKERIVVFSLERS